MATNHYSEGKILDHVAAADIESGELVSMDEIEGVAQTDIATGKTGAVSIAGVYSLPKAAGTAWVQGNALLTTTGELSPGAGPHIAAAAATSAATTGLVLLNGNSG